MRTVHACLFVSAVIFAACANGLNGDGAGFGGASSASSTVAGTGGSGGTTEPDAGTTGEGAGLIDFDASGGDSGLDPDAACATAAETAVTTQLPVDIIWIIDNSASMASAITEVQGGLNAFAALIEASQLDYRVIMLSLRSPTSPIIVGGSTRYPVCIPQPLAGDAACGDGARFLQSSIDIRSTQPLEQFLGTLGQTTGYKPGETKGGTPWAQFLRPEATKTIIVVTDDNARLSATDFETFPGGTDPFNSTVLPPGILDPSWAGLFDGYLFSGIYGYGSEVDPSVVCTYADQTQPASAGPTYTTLVNKTGGVRAQLCDAQAAWAPFFDAVAQAVLATSKLVCELPIPTPAEGDLDFGKVNVQITGGAGGDVTLAKVADAAACGPAGGWYYNDPQTPTSVILCPVSCDDAQAAVGPGKDGSIQVLFGCETIIQ